jgi:hypothetical protein
MYRHMPRMDEWTACTAFLRRNSMKIVDGSFIAVTGAGIIYYQSTLGSNSSDASDSVAIARNATNARWHINCITFVCSMSRYVTVCCGGGIWPADDSSLCRTLKDIRQTPPSDSHSVEVQLWEEIKVVAFSNLFVASYMLCAMSWISHTDGISVLE